MSRAVTQMENLFAPSENVWFERETAGNQFVYVINGTPGRTFKFSALNGIFVKDNSHLIYCCSISLKEDHYQICRLTEEDFWCIIKGKHFKVISDNSTSIVNASSAEEKEAMLENTRRLFSLLDAGNEQEASVLVRPAPCYQFVELSPEVSRATS